MDRKTGPAVVLTRQPEDNRELAASLTARGAVVREIPCLATRYVKPDTKVIRDPDAVVFTSRRGVIGFFKQRFEKIFLDSNRRVLLAAIGHATAHEIESHHFQVDITAKTPEGAVLANQLIESLPSGSRLLMIRGNLRASEIDTVLKNAGYQLTDLVVYENIDVPIEPIAPFQVAAVFIASPSAARRLLSANPWMAGKRFFTIGKTTAGALKELGCTCVEEIGADLDTWVNILFRAYQDAIATGE